MKPKYKIFCLLAICLVASCAPSGKTKIVRIDLNASPDAKTTAAFLNRLSVRLVPMETTEASLFNGNTSDVIVCEDGIFVLDMQQFSVLRFGKEGDFIHKIHRQGNGPGEYLAAFSMAVSHSVISILDIGGRQVQQYDLNGNHLRSIPVDRGYDMVALPSGDLAISGSYVDEFILNVYDTTGAKVAGYFPRQDNLADMMLTRGPENTLGLYGSSVYIANYFDPSIYLIKDNKVDTLFTFDFVAHNIPGDLLLGTPEVKMSNFTKYRSDVVMSLGFLTVNDSWVIFSPEKRNAGVVFYDIKQDKYILNKGFEFPYSVLLGGYRAPEGCTDKGEYYSMVESLELRDIILELAEKDAEYLSKYPFLKGLDPEKIAEDDNPWMMFYSIK